VTHHHRIGSAAAAAVAATLFLGTMPSSTAGAAAAAAASSPATALGQAHAHLAGTQPLLKYYGGTNGVGVEVHPKVYLVFWGSQWGTAGQSGANVTLSNDVLGAAPYLQDFIRGLFGSQDTWSRSTTQYCQGVAKGVTTCPATATFVHHPTTTPLAGVWADVAALTPVQATDKQLGKEADRAAVHFGHTTPTSNKSVQYVIVSPSGTHPGGFNLPTSGFCAWHDFTRGKDIGVITTRGSLAFTNMPYVSDAGPSCGQGFVNTPGTLDGFSIVEGHEYAETVTDEWPQAPIGGQLTSGGWYEPNFGENGDKCAWITPGTPGGAANITLSTGSFPVQSLWSNLSNVGKGACVISYP
jgi:serine protease